MAEKTVLNELADIIRTALNDDPGPIQESTTLEALGVNSLELVEIIMVIEERYDVSIEVDAVEAKDRLKTVGDLMALGQEYGLGSA